MKRKLGFLFAGISLFAMLCPATGCAPARRGGPPDATPEFRVRVPAAESPDVRLRAEEAQDTGEPSVLTDDTQRPWLKVIEVEIHPKETEKTDGTAESPGE